MTNHVRIVAAGLLWAALAACSGTSDVSGIYIENTSAEAVMVQLVQTPDGKISGEMTGVSLGQKGQIQDLNAAFTGLVSGRNISLEWRPGSILSAPMQLSGAFDGGRLTLNSPAKGGVVSTLALERGKVTEFQTAAAKVRDASQKMISENAAAEAKQQATLEQARVAAVHQQQAASIDTLITRLDRVVGQLGKANDSLDSYSTRYQAITAKMKSLLDREKGLSGQQNVFARGQLSSGIAQNDSLAEQLHFRQSELRQTFDQLSQQIAGENAAAIAECVNSPNPAESSGLMAPDEVTLGNACQRLYPVQQKFAAAESETRKRFDAVEAFYAAQKQQRQTIVSEASRLAN